MEEGVRNLEALFQKADSDLNYLTRKLEFDMEKGQGDGQINPAKLIQKLEKVKKEYASLRKEGDEIMEMQKTATESFRSELQTACNLLQKLQQQTGAETSNSAEELIDLQTALGIQLSEKCNIESTNEMSRKGDSTGAEANPLRDSVPRAKETASAYGGEAELSPLSRRAHSSDFIELSAEEFEKVSSLVRGRVKLADVNSVYRTLWRIFKEEKRKSPLTPSDMNKMGLKVAGATGEAKLKVLRASKLLKITGKGDVTLT